MKIGDVSERLGIPASTIRYYEKVGLLEPPPRVAGSRRFDKRSLFELDFIILAQAAGFTIAEIKHMTHTFDNANGPKELWQEFANDKRDLIRKKIDDLNKMDTVLSRMLSCECPTLEDCVKSTCCSGAPPSF